MSVWIFHSNPRKFRLNDYLCDYYQVGQEVEWGIRQEEYLNEEYHYDLAPGAEVYIWRAKGGIFMPPGIVAHGIITSYPLPNLDRDLTYWIVPDDQPARKKVSIRLDELRLTRKYREVRDNRILYKRAIARHPILKHMLIMRFFERTNYLLENDEPEELHEMWIGTRENNIPVIR